MQNLLTPLLANTDYLPYGITDAALSDIIDKTTAFNNLIGRAGEKQSGNTTANTAINAQIKKLHDNITQLDLLVDEFEASNPQFVQGYHINSAVDNIGVHHTAIEGKVMMAGTPVTNATVAIQDTDKTAITDLKGYYRIERIMPGDYEVAVSANSKGTKSKVLHISRGRIEEVNFDL